MGVWAHGNFDNDTALDWLDDITGQLLDEIGERNGFGMTNVATREFFGRTHIDYLRFFVDQLCGFGGIDMLGFTLEQSRLQQHEARDDGDGQKRQIGWL